MGTKAQKIPTPTVNLALKVAIVETGKTSRAIAAEAGIPEVQLSKIVRGRIHARSSEQKALAKALKKPRAVLFPEAEAVAS